MSTPIERTDGDSLGNKPSVKEVTTGGKPQERTRIRSVPNKSRSGRCSCFSHKNRERQHTVRAARAFQLPADFGPRALRTSQSTVVARSQFEFTSDAARVGVPGPTLAP